MVCSADCPSYGVHTDKSTAVPPYPVAPEPYDANYPCIPGIPNSFPPDHEQQASAYGQASMAGSYGHATTTAGPSYSQAPMTTASMYSQTTSGPYVQSQMAALPYGHNSMGAPTGYGQYSTTPSTYYNQGVSNNYAQANMGAYAVGSNYYQVPQANTRTNAGPSMHPGAAPFRFDRTTTTNEDASNTESVGGGVSLDPALYNNSLGGRWGPSRGMVGIRGAGKSHQR